MGGPLCRHALDQRPLGIVLQQLGADNPLEIPQKLFNVRAPP